MMKSISLIIQGPIISTGKSGNMVDQKISFKDYVSYNSVNNINQIVKLFGNLFDNIVLSTWISEKEYCKTLNGVDTLFLEDPTPKIIKTKDKRKALHNKFKHFYGVQKGIEYVKDNFDSEYVIKIRTDQLVNLSYLVTFINSNHADRIYVPYFRTDASFWIPDFYFLGKTSKLLEFFQALNAHDFIETANSAHREIFFKYALALNNRIFKFPELFFFNNNRCFIELKQIGNFMYSQIFSPLPKIVYSNLEWRGNKFSDERLEKLEADFLFSERFNINNIDSNLLMKSCSDPLKKVNFFNMGYYIDIERYLKYKTHLFNHPSLKKRALIIFVKIYSRLSNFFGKLFH